MSRTLTRFRLHAALLLIALPGTVAGQVDAIAPQLSIGDADVGIGVRFAFGTPSWHPDVEIQLSFDVFFPDSRPGVDVDYFEFNANVVRDFRLAGNQTLRPYAGAGFNIARFSRSESGVSFSESSDVDLGVNILGGLRFDMARYDPFVEVRFEIGGGDQGVLTGGIRIPT